MKLDNDPTVFLNFCLVLWNLKNKVALKAKIVLHIFPNDFKLIKITPNILKELRPMHCNVSNVVIACVSFFLEKYYCRKQKYSLL